MDEIIPNPDQIHAITAPYDQPVRIVAGAGTGKTEVISQRYLHLLRSGGLHPTGILVLTFSEKAAAEMRARILKAVATSDLDYTRVDLAGAQISTFHSFGATVLRHNSLAAGVDPGLPMVTERDTADILDAATMSFLDRGFEKAYSFDPIDKEAYTWESGGPIGMALSIVEQLQNQAVSLREFNISWQKADELSDRQAILAPLIRHMYDAYLRSMKRRGQLDFDRLINGAVDLLEKDSRIRDRVLSQYRAVMVDEYQDTNYAQERLLRALACDGMVNVAVVGDPRQAIYVWREARVENIASFPGDGRQRFEAPLTCNWRSMKPVLDLANKAIAPYALGHPPEYDAKCVLEPARPSHEPDAQTVVMHLFVDRLKETEGMGRWIHQLRDTGYTFGDIAILIRARTYIDEYTDVLRREDIPFELAAGDAFYTRPEIMDAIHMLSVCIDPSDRLSVIVTLLGPVVGLTQADVADIAGPSDLWKSVLVSEFPEPKATRVHKFLSFWKAAQRERWCIAPSAFVAWAVKASGLEQYISSRKDEQLTGALSRLYAIAHLYETEHPGDGLSDLVDHLRQQILSEPREKTPEIGGQTNAVQVITAHASKGLEFPVVIVVDNRQRTAPSVRKGPFYEPDSGLIFPEDNEEDPHYIDRIRHTQNEARCLWYVTLTRAKERLILTASYNGEREPDGSFGRPRTFFQELWNSEIENPTSGVTLRDD